MFRSTRSRAPLLAVLAVAALSLASPTSAETFVSVSGGVAVPWKGDVGYAIQGELGGNMWNSKFFRGGLEFEYRQQKAALTSGGGTVDFRGYGLRGMGRFFFNPGKFSPYLGGGGGLSILQTPSTSTNGAKLGVGGTVIGLAGAELPFAGGRFAVFSEARLGYTWDFSSNFSHVQRDGFDGFTGVAGFRTRF